MKNTKLLDTDSIEFEQEVQKLKNKYGSIYQIEIADQRFIFKPLSRKDYKDIMGAAFDINMSNDEVIFNRENMIAKTVIVYPDKKIVDNMLETFAGISEVIAEECMKISGFVSENNREVSKL